jgi:hypothetical protein
MKHLVGKIITEKVPFMGEEVEVRKLSVGQVIKVQELTKEFNKKKGSDDASVKLLREVIKLAVVGAEELTDEDFNTFPLEELNQVSEAILALSGVNKTGKNEGN